eukprot:NODE_4042_length_1944_cov_8.919097.p1 GENE.NODE_4042_length_1944_cov_8.919097~~NODE_4042_length_1944_cov_8.919097.p1  ORF type:complete len:547 (+),score=199.20 NODE_4042_length_1944_cov_8.919097:66-1706(+)
MRCAQMRRGITAPLLLSLVLLLLPACCSGDDAPPPGHEDEHEHERKHEHEHEHEVSDERGHEHEERGHKREHADDVVHQQDEHEPEEELEHEHAQGHTTPHGHSKVHKSYRKEHHKVLWPLNLTDYLTLGLATLALILAAGSGIGGGGLLVPLYILVARFSPVHAVPLSNITIFGGALANFTLNVMKRHPNADRPLIDFDIMLVMEPMTILGALGGALLNIIMPPWLTCILLVLLLGMTTYRTGEKGVKMYKKETAGSAAAICAAQQANLKKVAPEDGSVVTDASRDEIVIEAEQGRLLGEIDKTSQDAEREQALEGLRAKEARALPCEKLALMFAVSGITLALTIGRISVTCGSWLYALLTIMVVPVILIATFVVRSQLLATTVLKASLNYPAVPGDITWDDKTTLAYPVICLLAGMCAGMFGIGGGIVKGPLMLEMGVIPEVAAATTAIMILFTTAGACAVFSTSGTLRVDYAIPFSLLGFLATLVGQVMMGEAIRVTGRASLIVFLIAAVIGVSTFAMGFESGLAVYEGGGHGRTLCSALNAA